MRARATQIQPLARRAVATPSRYRTHEQNLVESELPVVEALLGRLQLDLIGSNVQGLRDPLRQPLMLSRGDVLDVELHPTVGSLHLYVRRRGVPAVLHIVVGALEISERRRHAEAHI